MRLHGFSIHPWRRDSRTCSTGRANRSEQVGIFVTLVGRLVRLRLGSRPLTDDSILLADPCFILEPDFNGVVCGKPWRCALNACGKFFERFYDLTVLCGMSWARTDVGEAKFLEKRSDISLAIVNAEALLDDPLEIDPSPANDRILLAVGPGLNDSSQVRQLFRAQS